MEVTKATDEDGWFEIWPDADDVAQWLLALEARVAILEREHADAIKHLAESQDAAQLMADSPTPDALQRVAILMHGRVLPIAEAPAPSQALIDAAASWSPMTAEERLRDEVEAGMARARRDAVESRRRIAVAERITGTKYEGLSAEELSAEELRGTFTPEGWRRG